MSWRVVVISSRAKIELKLGYLVVRTVDETRRILIDDISVLVIENTGCSITGSLLEALWKKKTAVLFCDSGHNPGAQLLPCYGSYDSSSRIMSQIGWSKDIKDRIWGEIVKEKIRKQAECLAHYGIPESEKVLSYASDVQPGDSTNREGHAAKVYFNALLGHSFSRADENTINAGFNYGYAILLTAICREIIAAGYLTQIGVNHRNPYNQFNLGSDFIEPFRPLVDMKVLSLPLEERLTPELKILIVNLLNEQVIVRGQHTTVLNAISIYVRALLAALDTGITEGIIFYSYGF